MNRWLQRLVGLGRRLNLAIELRQLLRLLRYRRLYKWLLVAVVPDEALLVRNLIEVGKQPVKILLEYRVIFVIVAAGAAGGQAHPYGGSRLRPVRHILDPIFLGDDAAFSSRALIAIKAGRDALFERRVGQKIAGELLDREPIVRHVAIESVDHPIAPTPHIAWAIGLVAIGIAITGGLHPSKRHVFPIPGRDKQAIHYFSVRARRAIAAQRVDLRPPG